MTLRILRSTMPMLRSALPVQPPMGNKDPEVKVIPRLRGSALRRMRRRVLVRAGFLCECDQCMRGLPKALTWHTFQLDHIVRVVDGGSNDMENLRALHVDCHARITADQRQQVATYGHVVPSDAPLLRGPRDDDMPC